MCRELISTPKFIDGKEISNECEICGEFNLLGEVKGRYWVRYVFHKNDNAYILEFCENCANTFSKTVSENLSEAEEYLKEN